MSQAEFPTPAPNPFDSYLSELAEGNPDIKAFLASPITRAVPELGVKQAKVFINPYEPPRWAAPEERGLTSGQKFEKAIRLDESYKFLAVHLNSFDVSDNPKEDGAMLLENFSQWKVQSAGAYSLFGDEGDLEMAVLINGLTAQDLSDCKKEVVTAISNKALKAMEPQQQKQVFAEQAVWRRWTGAIHSAFVLESAQNA